MTTKTKHRPKSKPHPRRPRQNHLPTMEPPVIPEIESLAEAYCEARDARMAHGKTEQERATLLLGLMHQHGLTIYERADGSKVEIAALEKVKVRRPKVEENGNGEE